MSRIKTFTWKVYDDDDGGTSPLMPDTEYLVMHEPTEENETYRDGGRIGFRRMGPYYLYVDEDGDHCDSADQPMFYGHWCLSHYVALKDLAFTRLAA